jgi:hypothetical protein
MGQKATSDPPQVCRALYDFAKMPVPRRGGPRHGDSGAESQVINFEQNWHRLSLYLSGGG